MNLDYIAQFFPFSTFSFLVYTVITLIISFILIKLFSFLINKATKKFDIEITIKYLLKDLVKYLIYIVAFIIILTLAGIDVNGLFVSLGIVGITIGFAARDIISSFVSGIFILFDKTVKVGEIIEVQNIKGEVKKLGFRTTTVVTPDNLIVTIPNGVLAKTPYINHNFFDEQRIDLDVIIPFNVDINKFKDIFIQEIFTLEWVLEDSPPRVIVKEMIDTGIRLKISAWAQDYSKIEIYRLNLADKVRKIINDLGE